MSPLIHAGLSLIALGSWLLAEPEQSYTSPTPRTRTFQFSYQATVTGLKPGEIARVWLPVPPSNDIQTVELIRQELPGKPQLGVEPQYGNHILYLEACANREGKVPLTLTYRVKRKELKSKLDGQDDATDLSRFLKPDARVPIDGKPLRLIEGRKLPSDQRELARQLYDIVDAHMQYRKDGTGWGQGDASWACDSGYGNCSDFHSLFIALARSQKIPAQFIIGFPLPDKHGEGEIAGYHCWAKFKPKNHGWIPVDISEANKHPELKEYYFGNLTENRVAFSVGRDLELVPRQDGPPLNFFVYPYIEVGGKPYPADRIERRFTYRDVGE